MKFSLVTFSFEDEPLDQILDMASNVGLDAIDLAGEEGLEVREIADILRSHSVKIVEVTGLWGTGDWYRDLVNPDASVRKAGIRYGKYTIDLAREFGQMTEICPITRREVVETYGKEKLMDEARKSVKELAMYAKDRGVTLLIESLNRYEVLPDVCLINRQDEAVELIKSIDSESLGILLDTFHCSIEESDIIDTIHKFAHKIRHVHLCDSNRYVPGSGHLDFKPILRAFKSIGYGGYLSLEPSPKPSVVDLGNSLEYLMSLQPFLK